MGSSGGGGGGGYMQTPVGPAIPGLPIAGAGSSTGSPFEYGKFQNFLPDVSSSGPNPMATGLRPEMFEYRSPSGITAQSDASTQIQDLRNELAKVAAVAQSQSQAQPGLAARSSYADDSGQYNVYTSPGA